jgi:hypothetical protein
MFQFGVDICHKLVLEFRTSYLTGLDIQSYKFIFLVYLATLESPMIIGRRMTKCAEINLRHCPGTSLQTERLHSEKDNRPLRQHSETEPPAYGDDVRHNRTQSSGSY